MRTAKKAGGGEIRFDALDRNHVMAVRHDAITGWKTHVTGELAPSTELCDAAR
jgi:hypothetical protein